VLALGACGSWKYSILPMKGIHSLVVRPWRGGLPDGARMTATLYNATGREILVLVEGVTVALPRVAPPQIVNHWDQAEKITFSVADGECTLTVGSARPDVTIELPPPREGVCYLVDDGILVRLPHRNDLLAVGAFKMISTSEDVRNGGDLLFALVTAYSTLPAVPEGLEDLTEAIRAAERDEQPSRTPPAPG
jgi:hypothetical protein